MIRKLRPICRARRIQHGGLISQLRLDQLYIAMFDEIDEGTAIIKCGGRTPAGESPFADLSDVPSDHYLWLSGQSGRVLRGEIAPCDQQPHRPSAATVAQ